MNVFHDKFSSGQVVKAAGISNATLQSWIKRSIIIGQKDGSEIEGGGSPGRHRRFSFHNMMEIVTAKALIDCGVSDLKVAFNAARRFAHAGTAVSSEHPERFPGLPYDTYIEKPGNTLLCVSGESAYVAFWRPGTDPLPNIRVALRRPIGFVALEMNELFDQAMLALGYHPQAVLEFAYSKNN